jgi:MFS transporter, CP family, cyanate transporter
MTGEAHGSRSGSVTPLFAALLIVALSLRPQIAALGPLAPEIVGDLGVPHAVVGLLTTIPVLCMGLFAPLGPRLGRRLGNWAAIAVSVALLLLGGLTRAFAPGVELLLALTVLVGIGTALTGPLLAMYVRERMPRRRVAGTSAYAGGTILGAALATAVAVPLAAGTGGWRGALVGLTLASAVVLAGWLLLGRGSPGATRVDATVLGTDGASSGQGIGGALHRLPVRQPVAWIIGILFGLQSWLYYGATAWLPSAYLELGWDPSGAAVLLSVVYVASLVATLLVPVGSRAGLSRRRMLGVSTAGALIGLLGLATAPAAAAAWAVALGLGLGATFTLLLTLPTDISDDPAMVGAIASLMLLIGYLMASAGPFVLGAARDATGSFAVSLWVLVIVAGAMLPLVWTLTPGRIRPPGPGSRRPARSLPRT